MAFNLANPIGTGTDAELLEFTRAAIARITMNVDHPRLWSEEDPYLYTLLLSLRGPDGDVNVSSQIVPLAVTESADGFVADAGE